MADIGQVLVRRRDLDREILTRYRHVEVERALLGRREGRRAELLLRHVRAQLLAVDAEGDQAVVRLGDQRTDRLVGQFVFADPGARNDLPLRTAGRKIGPLDRRRIIQVEFVIITIFILLDIGGGHLRVGQRLPLPAGEGRLLDDAVEIVQVVARHHTVPGAVPRDVVDRDAVFGIDHHRRSRLEGNLHYRCGHGHRRSSLFQTEGDQIVRLTGRQRRRRRCGIGIRSAVQIHIAVVIAPISGRNIVVKHRFQFGGNGRLALLVELGGAVSRNIVIDRSVLRRDGRRDALVGHLGDVDREVVALGHAGLALVDHDAQLGHRAALRTVEIDHGHRAFGLEARSVGRRSRHAQHVVLQCHAPSVGFGENRLRHAGALDLIGLGLAVDEGCHIGSLAQDQVEIRPLRDRDDRPVGQREIDVAVVLRHGAEKRVLNRRSVVRHGLHRLARGIRDPLPRISAVIARLPVTLFVDRQPGGGNFGRHAQFLPVDFEDRRLSVDRLRPVVDAVLLLHADHRSILARGAVLAVGNHRFRVVRKVDRVAFAVRARLDLHHRDIALQFPDQRIDRRDFAIELRQLRFEFRDAIPQIVQPRAKLRVVVIVRAPAQHHGRERQTP